MSDYSLGSARGTIELDYNGKGVEEADSGLKSVASSIGKFVGVGVAGLAAVAAGVAGLALKGGLDRALNIQDAQAKLIGLGHSAESVTQIMQDALSAVRGTAFGLDEAATVAASAVAAGIKPGEQLAKYLKLTADAATIAGTSLGEMGSIINKVSASGKVATDNLNQLSDRGIPIFQWLQEEYGVSAEALSKMVSQGKVDAATFQRVIEKNIGGAALQSGQTARGALDNVGAALSRLGVAFVQPSVNAAPALFQAVAGALDRLTTAIAPIATYLGAQLGVVFGKLAVWITNLDFEPFIAFITRVALAFRDMIASIASGDLDAVGGSFGEVLTVAAPLLPLFKELAIGLGNISGSLGEVLAAGLPLLVPLLHGLAQALQFLGDNPALLAAGLIAVAAAMAIAQVATAVNNAQIAASIPLRYAELASAFATRKALRENTAARLAETGATVAQNTAMEVGIATQIRAKAALIAMKAAQAATTAVMAVITAAQWAWNAAMLANPIGLVVLAIAAIIAAVIALVAGIVWLVQNWDGVVQFFKDVWDNIVSFFEDAVENITNALIEWGVVDFVVERFNALRDFFTGLWNGIVAIFSAVGAALFAVFVQPVLNFVGMIVDAFNGFMSFVGTVFAAIMAFIAPFVSWFGEFVVPLIVAAVNLVAAIMNFLWQTILFVFGQIQSFIGTVVDAVVTFFTERWQAMVDFVTDVVKTMQMVIAVAFEAVRSTVSDVLTNIGNFFTTIWNNIVSFVTGVVTNIVNFVVGVFRGWLAQIMPVITPIFTFISGIFTNIYNFVSGIVANVVSFVTGVWGGLVGTVSGIFMGVYNAIKDPIQNAIDFIMGFKDTVMNIFSNAGKWLVDAGKNIIKGLKKGIEDALGGLTDLLNGITAMIPKTKGPPEKDKILLTPAGESIMDGLIRGIASKTGALKSLLTDLSMQIAPTFENELQPVSALAAGNTSMVDNRQFHYHAAPGTEQLSGEEELEQALRRARVVAPGWVE